jgi:hypothetical protein
VKEKWHRYSGKLRLSWPSPAYFCALELLEVHKQPGMEAYTCNPSTQEAEAEGL